MHNFLFKYKGKFIVAILLTCISSIFMILESFFIKALIDSTVSRNFSILKKSILIYFGFILLQATVVYLARKTRASYIKKTMIYIKSEIFSKLLNQNLTEFRSENSAKKISLLTNDIKLIEDDYISNIFILVLNITSFVSAIISLFILSPLITISSLVVIAFVILIPKIFSDKLVDIRTGYSKVLENFTLKIKDIFCGIEVIKVFNIEEKIQKDYSSVNTKVEVYKYKFNLLNSKVQLVSQVLLSMVFLSLFSVGSYLVIIDKITYGAIVACLQLLENISSPIYNSIEYINRIKSLKNINLKITKLYNDQVVTTQSELKQKLTFENCIDILNLQFAYEPTKTVLQNVNIRFEKNKKYAIVGESGSGKSTLLQILLKNLNNYHGKVLLDGIDLEEISYESLYSLVSIIHQNVFLFDTSIKENITLYGQYCENQIENVINKSSLSSVIKRLPDGLDTQVGESGNNLSGGEKQRISIARTLLKNVPILMLDEATSALDNQTAYDIEDLILSMKDITCLVVTHKLNENLLKRYDEIFVLRDGYLIEKGTFEELIGEKGYFYSLFNVYKH